ncbi:CdaR family protein [Candidatus Aminicenantes bacterium AC-708-M15]|jgi:hypothetical protein|nr:CdaR family protein [SCandidatus Aminicenantes bacterium Aminicenantia_JdfR_composite]MCP2597203.1 CdaR family protein [Candidatus Aminicenantes bacterium AC-335-G13]MCP2598392.1 CdaR family protein [Candidatus Aminicenantes bacterium AC-335-L06]MCP2604141.1 CdaR family protein [Candidatus Aminicenantes bacterium AC-708-M15]MCP2606262.1 CdaR family protein [Candidatus Aminicenantes bacterium AC-708-I09]MCP2617952.1 CdaR family protein [Candidatus Aminicenantes bacterium AC-335-A11]
MKEGIKSLFLRNWELKLFSIILSFIIWLALVPKIKTYAEKNLTIPLEIYNIPPGLEIVERPPQSVDIIVRAPKSILEEITPLTVTAKLNLENASPLQEEYPITKEMIFLPEGAEVLNIIPNLIRLKLEKTKETYLKIEPYIVGDLPPDFRIEKIEVIPPVVKVQGPESKVIPGEKIRTSPIDISNLETSMEIKPTLILPNPFLRLASEEEVKIRIKIVKTKEKVAEENKK